MIDARFIEELNEKQQKAVKEPRCPILLLAGPGTGKTRTLIARIIYEIVQYKIPSDQILALTFSNKAVKEIRQRLQIALEEKAAKVKTSTFHSFCLEVLRKYPQRAGLHRYFSVCDEAYQRRLLLELLRTRVRNAPEKKIRGILLAFSNYVLKDKPLPPFSAMLYDEYQEYLARHRLIDFNQLLSKTLQLFKENKDILEQYRFMNQSILVDEFQDTDPLQYQIVKLLAAKHRNIFIVADDDQSIYAWRGAHPKNILQYMEDFEIHDPIYLEQNYRCGKTIMDAAQTIVRGTERVEPNKIIRSVKETNSQIQALFFDNERQEISYILKKITDWHKNHHIDFGQIAVIFPRHIYGDKLADYLLNKRIPFQLARGRNLLENPTMKKIMLYLKLIHDPTDELILQDLLESELGYHVFKQAQELQRIRQVGFKKAMNLLINQANISYKVRNSLSTFIGNIANLINLKSFFTFRKLMQEIVRGIQKLNLSVLQTRTSRLEDIAYEKCKNLRSPHSNLWLYHTNEKIQFIARQLLTKMLNKQVHLLEQGKVVHLKPADIVLLLEPFPTDDLPCRYELLFKEKSGKRKGDLSVLFRWLQAQLASEEKVFSDYVVFDLETTGKDADRCGIVEIAAVKVQQGQIVDRFQSLVNPHMPIEPGAQAVHHITEKDIADAPMPEEIWPKFMEFVGNEVILAHNGYSFDFKIMDRMSRELNFPRMSNVRYDTLILSRILFPGQQNSIDALAERFHLDAGTRHRALDDVVVLHEIFQRLLFINRQIETKTLAEEFTEYVALGNALGNTVSATEDRIYFNAGIRKLLSPFSEIRKPYAQKFLLDDEALHNDLMRIYQRLFPGAEIYNKEQEFFNRIVKTAEEFNHLPVDQAIAEFLSFISLMNTQDNLEQAEAVSLLTFHAAKGLEFECVIITGMEDDQMPSFFAYKKDDDDDRPVAQKIEEQKRLLYVGITRGKSEVVFTVVKNRFGREQKSSPFLEEIKSLIKIKNSD